MLRCGGMFFPTNFYKPALGPRHNYFSCFVTSTLIKLCQRNVVLSRRHKLFPKSSRAFDVDFALSTMHSLHQRISIPSHFLESNESVAPHRWFFSEALRSVTDVTLRTALRCEIHCRETSTSVQPQKKKRIFQSALRRGRWPKHSGVLCFFVSTMGCSGQFTMGWIRINMNESFFSRLEIGCTVTKNDDQDDRTTHLSSWDNSVFQIKSWQHSQCLVGGCMPKIFFLKIDLFCVDQHAWQFGTSKEMWMIGNWVKGLICSVTTETVTTTSILKWIFGEFVKSSLHFLAWDRVQLWKELHSGKMQICHGENGMRKQSGNALLLVVGIRTNARSQHIERHVKKFHTQRKMWGCRQKMRKTIGWRVAKKVQRRNLQFLSVLIRTISMRMKSGKNQRM